MIPIPIPIPIMVEPKSEKSELMKSLEYNWYLFMEEQKAKETSEDKVREELWERMNKPFFFDNPIYWVYHKLTNKYYIINKDGTPNAV